MNRTTLIIAGLLSALNLFSQDNNNYNDFIKIFYATRLYEDKELEKADRPVVVSLGANCIPAYQAGIHGIRSAAYPFDWLVSDIESIIINLEENFLHFLDQNYCAFIGNWIINSYDKMLFLHEFHEFGEIADLQFLPLIQAKYQRRIERFRQLKNEKKGFLCGMQRVQLLE